MPPPSPNTVRWRLRLRANIETVFKMLSTNEGRNRFWAEDAPEVAGEIAFHFANGQSWHGQILENTPPQRFSVEYIGGSKVTFELSEPTDGGTELLLVDEGVSDDDYVEVLAGWVSVLLALKAAVDFKVDLRNHDPHRCWDQRYVGN